ncbi:hypothetical protein BBW65_04855 [Helicobacter enhydrae]|uniref:Uncharacterized protein n=1 Tax=Helicobacter enhydrae TaxID=222136 RepID=A0A1B1U5Y4_9HELI|nr:hypothetical protein [Helicobacter enhydrae]ANV98169.1 hypothetical protein BBW65_04855 [Helicobacter enhydrae]
MYKIATNLWVFLCFWLVFGLAYAVEQKWIFDYVDPLKPLYFWSGWLSFACLLGGLILPNGRFWGLIALVFAILHLSVFVYFDFYFDFVGMLEELSQKYYLYFGLICLIGFVILGGFSFAGKFYPSLVFVVMLCVFFGFLHIIAIQKVVKTSHIVVGSIVVCVLVYKIFQKINKSRRIER